MARDGRYTWAGFVALAFLVLGILAIFTTYALPVPLERAMARDQALDEALAADGLPDQTARLEALRPRLDESAEAVLRGPGTLAARIGRERVAMHARFDAEARALARRLRLMIVVVTAMCMIFGVVIVAGFSGPRKSPPSPDFTNR